MDAYKQNVETITTKIQSLESPNDDAGAYEKRDAINTAGPSVPGVTTGEVCTVNYVSLNTEQL